ncbi:hypothetical protein BJV77DRAFT_943147 [Russula vinacea]|nr:hypothetical protein BJV77DRAFT_943147 [Russula vinacea]
MYSSVCICNNFRAVLAPIDLQLFDFVYKPVRAVILLSPICGKLEELRQREQVKINGSSSLSIVLCSRSSSRPCASLALLNLIIARLDQQRVRQDWHLDKNKTPLERTKSLESEDLLEIIHAAATASSQTAVLMDTDLHFTCFVQAPEASTREAEIPTGKHRLIELDGGRAGPVDYGSRQTC